MTADFTGDVAIQLSIREEWYQPATTYTSDDYLRGGSRYDAFWRTILPDIQEGSSLREFLLADSKYIARA